MLDAVFVEKVNPPANSSRHSNALFTMKNAPRANVATKEPCRPRYDPLRANVSAKTIVSPLVNKTIVLNPPKKMLWTSPGLGQTNPVSRLFIRRNTYAPNSVPKNAISPKMKNHIPRETFSSRANGHFSPTASIGSETSAERLAAPPDEGDGEDPGPQEERGQAHEESPQRNTGSREIGRAHV